MRHEKELANEAAQRLAVREEQVLDHGYVRLIETWGSDERVIESARMSTQKGFLGWGPFPCKHCGRTVEFCSEIGLAGDQCPDGRDHDFKGDEKLLAYLWKNNHATPFEMAGAIFEVQAPIFVFREWHRHRTQSYNEMSARYAPLPDLSYAPTVERVMLGGGHLTKQAASADGAGALDEDHAATWLRDLAHVYDLAQRIYESGLARGIPKELARLVLPVGRYSRMRASANLRNWLGFLALRDHPAAQWEIRQYAEVVRSMLAETFPRTLALYAEGRP